MPGERLVTLLAQRDVANVDRELAGRRAEVSGEILRGERQPVRSRPETLPVPLIGPDRPLVATVRQSVPVDIEHRVRGLAEAVEETRVVGAAVPVRGEDFVLHLDVVDRGPGRIDADLIRERDRPPLVRQGDLAR